MFMNGKYYHSVPLAVLAVHPLLFGHMSEITVKAMRKSDRL